MFLRRGRRADSPPKEVRPDAAGTAAPPSDAGPDDAPGTDPDEPAAASAADRLTDLAAERGIAAAPENARPAIAEALAAADPLWTEPEPGAVQLAARALLGGRAPLELHGVQLWPVLTDSPNAPALVLADLGHRVHVVVDVLTASDGQDPRPRWVGASTVAPQARMPGSFALWRRWQPELSERAPHGWSSYCAGHLHVGRADENGAFSSAIPLHDSWMMCRWWLPERTWLSSIEETHWVVLALDDASARQREPLMRGRWEVTSYADFVAVLAEDAGPQVTLAPAVNSVVALLLATLPLG